MSGMLKTGNGIKWGGLAKDSFSTLKKYVGETPMIMSPHYKQYLIFSIFLLSTLLL